MNKAIGTTSHSGLLARALSGRAILTSVTLTSAVSNLGLVGIIVFLLASSKFEPFVLVAHKNGKVAAIGPAQRVDELPADDRRLVEEGAAATFFETLRTVTPDAWQQRNKVVEAYRYLEEGTDAFAYIGKLLRNEDPFKFGEQQIRTVEILWSSRVDGPKSQAITVEWCESVTDHRGNAIGKGVRMRGTAVPYRAQRTPQTPARDLMSNPLLVKFRKVSIQPGARGCDE